MSIRTWTLRCALALCLCGCASDGGDEDANAGAGGGDGDGDKVVLPEGFGDEADRNQVAAGEICPRLAVLQCIAERDCCSDPGRDLGTCLEDQQRLCETRLIADQISLQAKAGFDETVAEAVLAQVEALARDCDPELTIFSLSPEGFGSMFSGTLAVGQNCAPQNLNDLAMIGGALASCRNRDTNACLPSSAMWRCEPRGDENAHCFTENNCLGALYCDNPQLSLDDGRCKARKPNGSVCEDLLECESRTCVDGTCTDADADSAYCYAP